MKIYLISGQVYNARILPNILFLNLIPRSSSLKGEWEVGREQERIKTRENDGAHGSKRVTEDLSPGPQEKNSIDPGKIPWSFIQENFSLQECPISVSEKKEKKTQSEWATGHTFKSCELQGCCTNRFEGKQLTPEYWLIQQSQQWAFSL